MLPERLPPLSSALAHEPFVRAVARAVLGGDADVDDVVQQTWVAAWRRPMDGEPPGRGWMVRVARNLARMTLRAGRRRHERERRAARAEGLPSAAEGAERVELGRRLRDAVAALDDPYRTTVLLRYYEGLSLAHIAERLAVPRETARTRLRRGLERLRARLRAERGGAEGFVALAPAPAGVGPASAWSSGATAGGLAVKTTLVTAAGAAALCAWIAWQVGGSPWSAPPRAVTPAEGGRASGAPALLGAERADGRGAARLALPASSAAPPAGAREASPGSDAPAARLATVAGSVRDQHGAPVADALVVLTRASVTPSPSARTDERGAFTIPDVPVQPWTLRVHPPRPAFDWIPGPPRRVQGGERAVEVTLTRLEEGCCALSVRALDGRTGEAVRLRQAALVAAPAAERGGVGADTLPAPVPEVVGGRAEVGPLRPGRWRVWGQAELDGRWAWADVEVAPGAPRADVALRFDEPGALRGRVDRSHVAAHVRRLFVTTRLAAGWTHPHGATDVLYRVAEVGADGTFELSGLLAGVHRVEVEAPGALAGEDVLVRAGSAAEVHLTPQPAGVLRLRSAPPSTEGTPEALVHVLGLGRADGPLEEGALHVTSAGETLELRRTLLPGRVRWRLRFPQERAQGSALEAFEAVEGEALIEAGRQTDVHVPLVRSRP